MDGALHLRLHTERIDDRAAIDGADYAIHTKNAVLCVPGDFRYLRDVAAPAKRDSDAAATAHRQWFVPSHFLRGQLDNVVASADIERLPIPDRNFPCRTKHGEQELERVAPSGMCGVIKKTREGEPGGGGIDGTPVAEGHAGFGDGEFKAAGWAEAGQARGAA